MPRNRVPRATAVTPGELRSRTYELAQPFKEIGSRLRDTLDYAILDWGTENGQEVLRDMSQFLGMFPTDLSPRFYFDLLRIQELSSAWGNVVQMSNVIIPVYGQRWQLERFPVSPMDQAGMGHVVQFLRIEGDDDVHDVELTDYPQLIHELLHSLFYQCPTRVIGLINAGLEPILSEFSMASLPDRQMFKERQQQRNQQIRRVWMPTSDQRNWSHELLIDVMSMAIAGPSYAHWFLRQARDSGIDPDELVASHPPFSVRAMGMLLWGRDNGAEATEPLAKQIAEWDTAAPQKSNDYLNICNTDLIASIVATASSLLAELKLSVYGFDKWERAKDFRGAISEEAGTLDIISAAFHASSALETSAYHKWLDEVVSAHTPEV